MTTLSQFPKPEADQHRGKRKLFLVPTFAFPPTVPEEGHGLLESYWSDVSDHINSLERSLGTVAHVYHESLFSDGDEGMKLLEGMTPKAHSFIQAMCQSTAKLEATEDLALVQESSDWHRCISIGLASEKVRSLAIEGLQAATQKRFEHIASRIDETLKEDETGAIFVGEDHGIQFPNDVQVFYVAPPSLDALKRWIDEQVRSMTQAAQQSAQADRPTQAEEEAGEAGQPSEAQEADEATSTSEPPDEDRTPDEPDDEKP